MEPVGGEVAWTFWGLTARSGVSNIISVLFWCGWHVVAVEDIIACYRAVRLRKTKAADIIQNVEYRALCFVNVSWKLVKRSMMQHRPNKWPSRMSCPNTIRACLAGDRRSGKVKGLRAMCERNGVMTTTLFVRSVSSSYDYRGWVCTTRKLLESSLSWSFVLKLKVDPSSPMPARPPSSSLFFGHRPQLLPFFFPFSVAFLIFFFRNNSSAKSAKLCIFFLSFKQLKHSSIDCACFPFCHVFTTTFKPETATFHCT